MLIEQQIAERQERAAAAPLKILRAARQAGLTAITPSSRPAGRTYRVAIRGLGLFENYCSCPDFAINTLGTCKHVEAMLLQLRKRHQKTLEAGKYKRTRASISLQYGEYDRGAAAHARFAFACAAVARGGTLRRRRSSAAGALPAIRRGAGGAAERGRPGGHL